MAVTETLRSSWTIGGARIFLLFDADKNQYRLATRWLWLSSFGDINEACDAFDALEMIDLVDLREAAHWASVEIRRTPKHRTKGSAMARAFHLLNCIENRLRGLRPQHYGSKNAVVRWIPINAHSKPVP